MLRGNVPDQFLNDDGLAYASAAEQSDFSSFEKWLDQINNFDSGLKHLRLGGLLFEGRSRPVDGHALIGSNRAKLVNRLPNHVHHPSECAFSHGDSDWSAQVNGLHSPHHSFSGFHGDATDATFAQ